MRLFHALTGLVATFFDSLADLVLRLAPLSRQRWRLNKRIAKIKENDNDVRLLESNTSRQKRLVASLESDVVSLRARGAAAKKAEDTAEISRVAGEIVKLVDRIEREKVVLASLAESLGRSKENLRIGLDRFRQDKGTLESLGAELQSSIVVRESKQIALRVDSCEDDEIEGGFNSLRKKIDENLDAANYTSVFEKPVDKYADAEKSAKVQSVIDSF